MMRQLHRNVLVGYWTEEPVAFAVDAYVFDYLLAEHDPETHQYLSKNYILPETYAQKWFTTLCVGVLPFEALFVFFDKFVTESLVVSSNLFLFQFALSLIKHMREGILKTKNVGTIYGHLRLDPSLPIFNGKINSLAMSIIEHAKDYNLDQYDLVMLRQKAFDEKLRARLEAAHRAHQDKGENQSSCITSSDDDDEDEDEDEVDKLSSTMKTLVSHMKQMRIE